MALDAAVDIQHNGFQPVVIPASGQGVHQAGKVPLIQVGVGLLQHPVQGLTPQQPRLAVLRHAEIRVQIQLRAALPEQPGAEGVNGGDLGAVNQRGLPLEMGVPRPLLEGLPKRLHNLAAQLRRRRLGKGDD